MKYLLPLLFLFSCFGPKKTAQVIEKKPEQSRGIASIKDFENLPLEEQIDLQARELEERENQN